jgi:hypothetical protein
LKGLALATIQRLSHPACRLAIPVAPVRVGNGLQLADETFAGRLVRFAAAARFGCPGPAIAAALTHPGAREPAVGQTRLMADCRRGKIAGDT